MIPTFGLVNAATASNRNPCRSEPARDAVGSLHGDVGAEIAIASRLTPTLDLRRAQQLGSTTDPCGSELARDGIGSRTGDVGADMAIASKLAPTFGLW